MCGGGKKSESKQQCCITFDDEGQCFGIVICERQCGIFPCKICAKDDDRVNGSAKWLMARARLEHPRFGLRVCARLYLGWAIFLGSAKVSGRSLWFRVQRLQWPVMRVGLRIVESQKVVARDNCPSACRESARATQG
jgi:hypothetical protein